MEAGAQQPITEREINVRQVTHWQPSWTQAAPGAPGTFSIQLILDQGAAEYVVRPTADDSDVLVELLDSGKAVYFDVERKVLMFENRQTVP
jgi:hypothetical protein